MCGPRMYTFTSVLLCHLLCIVVVRRRAWLHTSLSLHNAPRYIGVHKSALNVQYTTSFSLLHLHPKCFCFVIVVDAGALPIQLAAAPEDKDEAGTEHKAGSEEEHDNGDGLPVEVDESSP
eukprot:TRINITY_DN17448_c0_g1_i1.p1 TRINITY_DN17448_c0_g1~~TRINITY_DN17448_c0_g1_i1.p1  ORF type:complete len:120 (-),score=3.78 TRINITY_DN17448_c0_g1_i1:263-622(-)